MATAFKSFADKHNLSAFQQKRLKKKLTEQGKDWRDVDEDDLHEAAEEIGILLSALRRFFSWFKWW